MRERYMGMERKREGRGEEEGKWEEREMGNKRIRRGERIRYERKEEERSVGNVKEESGKRKKKEGIQI